MYNYKARVKRVVDGDTIDVVIDLGFKVYVEQRLRLARINAPELKDKSNTVRMLANLARDKVIELIHDKEVTITTSKTDIYGRYIAEVVIDDEKNISDYLLEQALAVPYK